MAPTNETVSNRHKQSLKYEGFVLTVVVMAVFVLIFLTLAIATRLLPIIQTGSNFNEDIQARYQAEAGIARLIATIRTGNQSLPAGTGETIVFALPVLDVGFIFSNSTTIANIGFNRYKASMMVQNQRP